MPQGTYVIGIVGGSGSGKTSFLRDLLGRLPAATCAVVSQDNYYRAQHEQALDPAGWINYDLPTAIDRARFHDDMRALLAGRPVTQREYTFNTPDRPARALVIAPARVLIMEGLFVFHYEEIRELLDLRVFVHACEAVCLQRRLQRDERERGYTREMIAYQWENHVIPAYRQYVLPYRDAAHVVVDNDTSYHAGLDTVHRHVLARLAGPDGDTP
jgi:uridine kinase